MAFAEMWVLLISYRGFLAITQDIARLVFSRDCYPLKTLSAEQPKRTDTGPCLRLS